MDTTNQKSQSKILRLGEVTLDLENRTLQRRGAILNLPEQYVKALIILIQRQPEAVSVKELSGVLGSATSSVTKQMQRLRQELGDTAERPQFIKTEPGRGYRFIGTLVEEAELPNPDVARFRAGPPEPQMTTWDPAKVGIWTGASAVGGALITWEELKHEVEQNLLPQVRMACAGSTIAVGDYDENRNWIVRIINPDGHEIGHVWFGCDPYENWKHDGLVRVGEAPGNRPVKVWQILQRYSDGCYKTIKCYA